MSHALAGAGMLIAAAAAAAALLWQPSPRRSAAMLVALALVPVLIVGEQWHSTAIVNLRGHPLRLGALSLLALVAIGALVLLFRRRPKLLPLAVIATLPFRIPLQAGAKEANLLVPLYVVIAAGVIAAAIKTRPGFGSAPAKEAASGAVGLIPKLLAATIALYALQSLYSDDFSRAVQNSAFFYVPFALAFVLVSEAEWDLRLLGAAFAVVVGESVVFALVGFWEYGARHLLWNPALIRSNDFHPYFRVNSLFWDPNVYGRYMALAITAIVAVLLWAKRRRVGLLAALAVVWLGLLTTFSQSSFIALLAGLAALAALRFSLRWTALVCSVALVGSIAVVLAGGASLGSDLSTQSNLNGVTSGRANLVSGGLQLFANRPLWGYGAGSFGRAFADHEAGKRAPVTLSHTAPVTVAAEQGILGLALYVALLATAFVTLLRGMRPLMPGLSRAAPGLGASPPGTPGGEISSAVARAAILSCFVVLVVHTLAYADFLEDPATWVLLSIGSLLSARGAVPSARRLGGDPQGSSELAGAPA